MGFLSDLGSSGIFGAIGGVAQSVIDARTQKRNIDMQNKANMKLAEYQYSKDLEMWNRANQYNSPAQQMARYKSAGLNPNLVYGSGSAISGNTATSLPKYNAPQFSYNYKAPINIGSVIGMYQDFKLRQAQIDNVKAIARTNQANADMKEIDKYYYTNYLGGNIRGVAQSKALLAEYMADAQRKRVEILDSQINGQLLKNLVTQKDLNWYTAEHLGNIVSKGIGALGVSKFLGGGFGLKTRSGLAPYQGRVNYSPELRGVTKYYYK